MLIHCFFFPFCKNCLLPFFSFMFFFCIYTGRLNAKSKIDTKSHVFFITLENSLSLKRNDCTPKYIFRNVLLDTWDMFNSRMILSAICSFLFYFFSPSVVLLSFFNISLWFHFSIFPWVHTFTPLFILSFCFMVCFSILLCWDSTQSLFGFMYGISKVNLTETCELFMVTPFQHGGAAGE